MAAVAVGPRMATEGEGSMLVDNISSEGIKRVVLSLLIMQKRIWKRMAFIWETCLQGKVWKVEKRTLTVLSMVSPIVVLSCGRLRVAPDNKWDKLSSFHCQSTSPLMKRSITFTLSAHLTPLLNGSTRTRRWCHSHQLSAFEPMSHMQWIHDCWLAPKPIRVSLRRQCTAWASP